MPRLLIAEDDPMLTDALVSQFQGAGFEVEHAPNGPVADYLLTRQPFDVAILDLGLPYVDGMDVLRQARRSGSRVPVLILTARDRVDDRVNGLNAGADDYLVKPFDFPELLARVNALLRRGQASAQEPSDSPAGLVLDRPNRRALLHSEVLDLTQREWCLLELLISRRDNVVTKEEITAAWAGGDGASDGSGSVEVYIHRLRKKLAQSGMNIRTLRGLGYLLEADRAADRSGDRSSDRSPEAAPDRSPDGAETATR
ncbi:response regulator transcription factor [Roseateles depolymerans]|uniref:Transcriptional regulator n=1 Tax=Roseateles depolymerans TaxID=76731 RepID=A0A0U3LPA2_9BURK|nr:response regulator transcription factor [Roseateles depolymerans]ALV08258.1 transcriptional regulator [Roseateles depolymerans]REG21517.1 winged helix family two component transcriptional regulator [Roseateles depolymerans]